MPLADSGRLNFLVVRVVLIITGLGTGGAEMMLLKMLQCMDRMRFTPHVISLTDKAEIGARIESLGIEVEALGMRPGAFSVKRWLRLVARLRALKPDLVHTWMYHADLLGGVAARVAGIPAVAWGLHNSNLDPDKSKRSTRIVMRGCALLSGRIPLRILSCSERARRIHVEAGYCSSKIVVVPNGFDLQRFQPNDEMRVSVRDELGLPRTSLLVGLIARDDPQKNHAGFIRAAALVHEALPDVQFVMAGAGIDATNATLRRAIDDAGLLEVVHMLGRRDDIPRIMASLDVVASSSHSEAFPNVLGEAMACGIPCVVTDAGDSAAIVGDTGRVVPVGDMAAFGRELLALISMPSADRRVLGFKARERVREHFEIGHVVRQYENFYLSLLEGGGTCAA